MTRDLPLTTRLWFAWVCFFRVLSSGSFAGSVARLAASPTPSPDPAPTLPPASAPPTTDAALQLLTLLQREGRLIDFLEQEIATFGDAEIGAAARVVHDGCRNALRAHAKLAPVRTEEEGVRVTVEVGFVPDEIKLTGRVQGTAPYAGILRHRGWRVTGLELPTAVRAHDASVIAPAEVELS